MADRYVEIAIFSKLANDQGERTICHCIGGERITKPGYPVYAYEMARALNSLS